jgi:hypothetical protein
MALRARGLLSYAHARTTDRKLTVTPDSRRGVTPLYYTLNVRSAHATMLRVALRTADDSNGRGNSYSRRTGSVMFHDIHAHRQVMGIAQFQIYDVTAPGKLVSAGAINPNSQDNCEPAPQPDGSWRFHKGVDAGWADSYKWQSPGQFVNFANDPDGHYVLRVTVNRYHNTLEADAGHGTNNVAYTYFRVTGSDIHVLKGGHGYSPSDPHKQVENLVFGDHP